MERNDELITYRTDGPVATITLDAPQRRNALSTVMLARLRFAFARAVADDTARVIVLDHTGPMFCAGADLTESAAAASGADLPATHLAEVLADMNEAPKPVIAVARGGVRGGGMGLLAAADLAICGTDIELAFSEVRLGVVPAVIAPVVARRLSPGKLRELFLTGEVFTGAQAEEWELISFASDEIDTDLAEMVAELCAGGPSALAGVKALTRDPELRATLRAAGRTTAEYFFAPEGREGVQSFLEKRSPSWVH